MTRGASSASGNNRIFFLINCNARYHGSIGYVLMIMGLLIAAVGAVLFLLERLGFPRLPGDILIQRGNTTFFFPVVTMLLLSIVLTIIVHLFFRK